MIFVKISQNFIKSHLKFWLISQISVHKLWHVGVFQYPECKGFIRNRVYASMSILPSCINQSGPITLEFIGVKLCHL